MASRTARSALTEIVSPAGNAEKLTFAVNYGADAVYFGGDAFNLRVKAGNFSIEEIESSLDLCKQRGVKTIFLLNAFLHEQDLGPAQQYLKEIKGLSFDALMVSDPAMKQLIEDTGIEADIHLSTQMSTLNHLAVRFWEKAGFKRIVLAREATLDEIKMIKENSGAELEMFIHGAVCVAYSGRCLMSRYLTGRDGNQGDCSQPCRWNYALIEKKRPGNYMDVIEHARGTEILSSKDLCLVHRVDDYVAAGVNAFKIEGRMKSLYYTANTTRIYKDAVRCAGTDEFQKRLPFWNEELDLISHRPYTDDLFNEFNNMSFDSIPYIKNVLFTGYKKNINGPEEETLIKSFNPMKKGDSLDVIYPIKDEIIDHTATITGIKTPDGLSVEMARPGEDYRITFDCEIGDHAILRKRL